jgi:hypothetical protein
MAKQSHPICFIIWLDNRILFASSFRHTISSYPSNYRLSQIAHKRARQSRPICFVIWPNNLILSTKLQANGQTISSYLLHHFAEQSHPIHQITHQNTGSPKSPTKWPENFMRHDLTEQSHQITNRPHRSDMRVSRHGSESYDEPL